MRRCGSPSASTLFLFTKRNFLLPPPLLIFGLHWFITVMRTLLTCWFAVFCLSAAAQAPQPPEIAARSYLLLDVTAQQVLASKDVDSPMEPASLTKLMSAYLVFDALKSKKISLTQTFSVSERAWKMPGSRMFIDPKMQVPVQDLIKGMVVQSGNDATMALAEGVGGDAAHFVQMMNDQARRLGMKSTGYKNPEGLTEPGHTTTARDLGILATRLMADFPEYMGYYAIKKYRYPGTPAANDNNRNLLLLRDPSVDGLKTGYTEAAGYCMVATAKRDYPGIAMAGATTGGRRLLSIVLGTANENARANESQKLLNWGFTAYEPVKLFEASQAVLSAKVWKGDLGSVNVGLPGGVIVAFPAGTGAKVTTEVVRTDPLVAPVAKGQTVASLRVLLGGVLFAEIPLQALDAVGQAGVLGRAWDALRLWIR